MSIRKMSILVAMALMFPALASPARSENLTEEKTVSLALERNLELKSARFALDDASGKVLEGFSGFLPKLSVGMSYTRLSEPQIKISGAAASMFSGYFSPAMTSTDIYTGQLSANQTLFAWGRVYHSDRQARISYQIAQEKYRQTKNETVYKAKELFYSTLLARKMLAIAEEAEELAASRYSMTQKLFDEGKASTYDVSRAKVALENVRVSVLRASNASRMSAEALKTFLNLDDDPTVTGEFAYEQKDYSLEEITSKALAARPEIIQARLRENAGKSIAAIAVSADKPYVAASYSYSAQSADYNTPFDGWDRRWQAGVSVQWPIFDGLASCGKVRSARAALEQIKILRRATEEGVKLEIRSTYLNFRQTKEAMNAQKENVSAAKANLDIAQKRYALGLMPYIELQDVHLAFSQAESNYQQSLYEYNLSLAAIRKITAEPVTIK